MTKKKNKVGKEKILTVFLIIVSVILLFSVTSDVPKNIIKSLFNGQIVSDLIASPADKKKNTLRETYNQINQYEKNHDYAALYDYLTPTEKALRTKEEYIQFKKNVRKNGEVYNIEFIVNDVNINEDVGIIDSTASYCMGVENCTNAERTSFRAAKQYFYIDGKWYHNLNEIVPCGRFEKYIIPEEFDRAVSLIIQRMKQSNDTTMNQHSKDIADIRNCLDIQYVQSDDEMKGTEGFFMFSENSVPDRLRIFVSPRYQIKDDLLTALLLSHEIAHAYLFASGLNRNISCYENEATAFLSQIQFMGTLNMEEISSITYRYHNKSSQEILSVVDLTLEIGALPGSGWYNKALNYVKNNPFYQKECASDQ